jgi:A/G-specific adenine glycosylase
MDWFAQQLLDWFDEHGRKDLPWQRDRSPYRTWVAEIMLQQTQVATVIPYFERFTERFADAASLAGADIDEVLHAWTGLGYYARGRNLHKAARQVVGEHDGELPARLDALMALPGIGRSTAGAILASAFGVRAPILDGNVKRLLARFHAVPGWPGATTTARTLWAHAKAHTPAHRIEDYTQAVMDLGSMVCKRATPSCAVCPQQERCAAHAAGTTSEYPGRRPKKALPVRAVRAFLIQDSAERTLLERRPLDGLWGGLWTPPERARDHSVDDLLTELGIPIDAVTEQGVLPAFRHTFTHFHMDIEPIHATLAVAPQSISDGDGRRWWHSRDNDPIGLSTAAVKLLNLAEAHRRPPRQSNCFSPLANSR